MVQEPMQMPILFWLDVKCGVMSKVGDGRGVGGE